MRRLSIIIISTLLLCSCEGFIEIKGTVYDKESQEPLPDVEIILVLNGNDTIRDHKLEYDTIPHDDRIKLREQGTEDDYDYYDPNGLSRFVPSMTNAKGEFIVGNMLVGCVPDCPDCELILKKNGYQVTRYKTQSIVEQGLKIYLEKEK